MNLPLRGSAHSRAPANRNADSVRCRIRRDGVHRSALKDMDMLVSLLALAAIIAVTLAGVAAAPWLSPLFVVFWSYNVWALYVAPNL
jgi:fatty acid desaturase